MMKRLIFLSGLVLALAMTWLILTPAESPARPEFSARQNEPCWKCHVSPMGGGMRNSTGFFYSQKSLGFEPITKAVMEKNPDFGKFVPSINDKMMLGMDMRVLFHDQNYDKNAPPEYPQAGDGSTFYFMQGAGYINAKVFPILRLAAGYDVASATTEAYGLIEDLPADAYIKIGRFVPPYGLRFDDHTIFTRDMIGFGPLSQDTGIEVGIRPGPFYLVASATNGVMGENVQDRDKDHYAVTAQTGVRFWKAGVGASYFHNTRDGLVRNVYGPWATLGFWKFAFLGEVDLYNQDTADTVDPTLISHSRGSASMAEMDLEIMQGLSVQARYSHADPDWALKKNYMDQTAAGFVFYPMPFMQTVFQYRFNREDQDVSNDEIMAQAHFFF